MNFKSFLNWIQSNNEPEPKGTAEKKTTDWNEKRRDNRVELEMGKQLVVHLLNKEVGDSASTLVASVRNVSVRGCWLIFNSPVERGKINAGQIFVASLAVDDFPIPLQVEVVRVASDREVAVRFKPPFPRELERLEKFLEPRCLGRSLREIDRAKLQKNQQKGLRWFQGVNETHLFCWTEPETKQVTQQQLVFLDRVVEWKEGFLVRTGMIRPDEKTAQGDLGWVKSELMDFDATPDSSTLHQAKTLLESSRIDATLKEIFLKKLS